MNDLKKNDNVYFMYFIYIHYTCINNDTALKIILYKKKISIAHYILIIDKSTGFV